MIALAQPGPSEHETLDAIGQAFFAASRQEGGPIVAAVGAAVVAFALAWLLRTALRETRRDRREQARAEKQHQAALAEADTHEHSEWIHVPAHLRLTLQHTDSRGRTYFEDCETQDVGGGSLTFLTHARPADGMPLAFTLDLHEPWPLRLQGVVAHVEASPIEGAPSLVSVKLGPVAPAVQEHLLRWVTHEELKAIAQARRGRVCAGCGRPLAEGAGERHATCSRVAVPARGGERASKAS